MHLETRTRDLLTALENGATGEQLRPYFHPDAVQVEHPSRVVPAGRTRYLDAMLEASLAGVDLFVTQRYDVAQLMTVENRVALQLRWSGILARPLGGYEEGAEMWADVAMFLTYDEAGRITRQESYDCYPAA
ncbi:nuclear transport factor 2 family protein [Nocardia huaxiensis]|uniref:Nuclear transport factor 2 family protein n=1 Tax=Nocardia huaxiensis TaxID=2755382 RepID=A0A7D7A153_9NOCA|nr:nuclear transport factor 2 family protein [Nocardia huaxiensis]QLY33409.1 nuclear transport factor 2 family protein [Nocardia huaxiensis]UFS99676.1 nuclear transport factor 2 family protein [Nocardia huaxiensis]